MSPFKGLVFSLALAPLFASSLVRAADCSDTPMAESCACLSRAQSERGQPRSAHSKTRKSARTSTQRVKTILARSNNVVPPR